MKRRDMVVFSVLCGLALALSLWTAALTGNLSWGMHHDAPLPIGGAARWMGGDAIYADDRLLYPPTAALAYIPLAMLPYPLAVALIAIPKLPLVAAMALWRGGLLAAVGGVTFLPVILDAVSGNVAAYILAAMALVVWRGGSWWSGVPLGIVLALFAKPMLVPFLAWALIFRRPAGTTAILTAGALTFGSLAATGVGPWLEWMDALRAGGRFAAPFPGNEGLSSISPGLAVAGAVVSLGATTTALVARREDLALVGALGCTILAVPYAGWESAIYLLLAVEPALRRYPRAWPFLPLATPAVLWALTMTPVVAFAATLRRPR